MLSTIMTKTKTSTFDARVVEAIRAYPSLYRDVTYELSRAKVLVHVILCYGTGEYWAADGSLQNQFPVEKKVSKSLKWEKDYFTKDIFEEHTLPGSSLPPIKLRRESREPVSSFRICTVCEYSPLMNIPDNARADALQACKDAWQIYAGFFVRPQEAIEEEYRRMHVENLTKKWFPKYLKTEIIKHKAQVKAIGKRLKKLGVVFE